MARARAGDREAFAELYRAFAPALYARVLLPKLGDAQVAQDALSDTFRSLLEHIAELDTSQSLWPWLCRVAANKANDVYRNRNRSRRALGNCERLLVPLLGADPAATPELGAERERLAQAVAERLRALSPRYQQALELRFLREHSRQECAAQMALKLGTFDVLLLRALRAFRREWELHFQLSHEAGSD